MLLSINCALFSGLDPWLVWLHRRSILESIKIASSEKLLGSCFCTNISWKYSTCKKLQHKLAINVALIILWANNIFLYENVYKMFNVSRPRNICTIWPSIWIVRNINHLLEHFSACIKIFITFCKNIHVKYYCYCRY